MILRIFELQVLKRGNYIVSDGWSGYEWVEEENSGYNHIQHIHGRRDFGYGIESTTHIESIWWQLKSEIRTIYYIIPLRNFLYYLGECEWRVKTKNLSITQKIEDIFEMYELLKNADADYLKEDVF